MNQKGRCFMLTDNGRTDGLAPTEEHREEVPRLLELDFASYTFAGGDHLVRFFIGQAEVAPDTGRLHHQAYIELHAPRTPSSLKAILGIPWLHVEHRRTTQQACIEYCSKEDTRAPGTTVLRYGSPSQEGRPGQRRSRESGGDEPAVKRRRDDQLREVYAAVRREEDPRYIFEQYPGAYLTFQRVGPHFEHLDSIWAPVERRINCYIIWGATGVGKSTACRLPIAGRGYPFRPILPNSKNAPLWFDGYMGQESILLDDFDGSTFPFTSLLQLADPFECLLPIKGASVRAKHTRLMITSNLDPSVWYPEIIQEQRDALFRRFKIFKVNTRADVEALNLV